MDDIFIIMFFEILIHFNALKDKIPMKLFRNSLLMIEMTPMNVITY